MKTLALDTSHRYLTVALIENDTLIQAIQTLSLKTQSETIMVEIDRLFALAGWKPSDLNALVLTDGPGSYTGLRISMTVAKVLGLTQNIQLYTISSLQLMAGTLPDVVAVMDARAKRVYLGHYQNGFAVHEDITLPIEEAMHVMRPDSVVVGDASLLHYPTTEVYTPAHFIDLRSQWKRVENVHTLVPRYLKETDDYGV
jgi:tRNA threonylcarbamoyladenosine biosynthesis protein TsaB